MWLIHCGDETLHDTMEMDKPPSYAILSHRWRKGEVLFRDIQTGKAKTKLGYSKLKNTLVQARRDGFDYVWIDSCCINKESSAELSEAINSMYKWYEEGKCIAYLDDVNANDMATFSNSAWFTRGWTLQELIAPRSLAFYDKAWKYIGDKFSLSEEISRITGIDRSALVHIRSLDEFTIAKRMSWAAKRQTTRIEDIAYCLLGIFDINMPLLYGEGSKAFIRLQQEIIRESDDHSIFAWSMKDDSPIGLLAESPGQFSGSENFGVGEKSSTSISMTNRGICLKLNLLPWSAETYWAFLGHEAFMDSFDFLNVAAVGIFIRRLGDNDRYLRVRVNGISLLRFEDTNWDEIQTKHKIISRDIYVPTKFPTSITSGFFQNYGFTIPENLECTLSVIPNRSYAKIRTGGMLTRDGLVTRITPGHYGLAFVMNFPSPKWNIHQIALGFDADFNPICIVHFNPTTQVSSQCQVHASMDCFCFLNKLSSVEAEYRQTIDRSMYRSTPLALKVDRLSGVDLLVIDQVGEPRQPDVHLRFSRPSESNSWWWNFSLFANIVTRQTGPSNSQPDSQSARAERLLQSLKWSVTNPAVS